MKTPNFKVQGSVFRNTESLYGLHALRLQSPIVTIEVLSVRALIFRFAELITFRCTLAPHPQAPPLTQRVKLVHLERVSLL